LQRRRERREPQHDRRDRQAHRQVRHRRILRAEEGDAGVTNTRKGGKSPAAPSVDNGRRSFFLKVGAGVSTALASTAVMAGAVPRGADDPALRAALLEDEQALRKHHRAFEQAMDKGAYDEVVEMF